MPLPGAANQRWSLDFVHDQMTDGRPFRILAVVDVRSPDGLKLILAFALRNTLPARRTNQIVQTLRLDQQRTRQRHPILPTLVTILIENDNSAWDKKREEIF